MNNITQNKVNTKRIRKVKKLQLRQTYELLKTKHIFSFFSNFWGIFVGFVGSEIHYVLEHHVLFSWSLTYDHSMRPLCDDHEEDGNDEFWIQVYQGGKSDLPSSHRVNLVPRPVILSKVLLTHPHCQEFYLHILIIDLYNFGCYPHSRQLLKYPHPFFPSSYPSSGY